MQKEMKIEYCINLCELLKQIKASGSSIKEYVTQVKQQAGREEVARLYVGSYFCSHYFLHLTEADFLDVITYAKDANCKITLVLPVFSEKNLVRAKKFLDRLSSRFDEVMDEITVNDYGMLVYIASKYRVKINLGRLFMKDYRDPRFPEYFNQTYKPRVFTNSLALFIKKYRVNMLEFDKTHAALDFSEKPGRAGIALHTPYCYMTTGQICEYSSISHKAEEKFRPNMECEIECLNHHIEYELDQLDPPRKFIRFGRTVYFENEDCKVEGLDALRIIDFPLPV